MKILDCESVDSTYESLEQILGVERSRLESLFNEPDLESIYESNYRQTIPLQDYLLKRVKGIASLTGEYDQTCWFHLTRVPESNRFGNGLLPLPAVVESIWSFLYNLVSEDFSNDQWNMLRESFLASRNDHAWQYRLKLGRAMDWGPFGILVRDVSLNPPSATHDYLSVPEIVEDICICFAEEFGFDILAAYQSKTKACIVKFAGPPRYDCIRAAVYYLYTVRRNMGFSLECNTCFNNEDGSPIPAERILKIEFPMYPQR